MLEATCTTAFLESPKTPLRYDSRVSPKTYICFIQCHEKTKENLFLLVVYLLSVCRCVQVIPVNLNGVPIGEIPFVRSGLLGFVGPVSGTVSLHCRICGKLNSPVNSLALTVFFGTCILGV